MMSFEEEDSGPSLKELVTKNLETNGILGKIQAELRASIFITLEDELKQKDIPLTNKKAQQLLSTPVGKLAVSIIQDFLQCLRLEFTLAVFNPESNTTLNDGLQDRKSLLKFFGKSDQDFNDSHPILFDLLEEIQLKKQENFSNKVSSGQNIEASGKVIPNSASSAALSSTDKLFCNSKDLSNHISTENRNYDITVRKNFHEDSAPNINTKSLNMPTVTGRTEIANVHNTSKSVNEEKVDLLSCEIQYNDEEFNSLSETKEDTKADSLLKLDKKVIEMNGNSDGSKDEDKMAVDENTEEDVGEEIEEDLSQDDQHTSCSGTTSDETKDDTISKTGSICDYQESL